MILEAQHISKWFAASDNKTAILKDINFSIDYGEMLYIVGPSGSGKTTLLSLISGILKPSEGRILFKNKDIWQLSNDELTKLRLYSIGFVFQDFHLFPQLSALENVAVPLVLQKISWKEALEQATHTLALLGLSRQRHFAPNKMSVGEQQRVAIARAIITKPELLIFDEPTASLDGASGQKIIAFIKKSILNENHAIVVVTHDQRIHQFANRILFLEDGTLSTAMKTSDDY